MPFQAIEGILLEDNLLATVETLLGYVVTDVGLAGLWIYR